MDTFWEYVRLALTLIVIVAVGNLIATSIVLRML